MSYAMLKDKLEGYIIVTLSTLNRSHRHSHVETIGCQLAIRNCMKGHYISLLLHCESP